MSTSRLYHREYGDKTAPPLVLLHGLGGASSTWVQVAELLSEKRRVIAPDLLGFGRSPWPDVDYSVDDHISTISALLDELGILNAPFNIAGHSMGGIIALEPAVRNKEIVKGVTLISFPYYSSAKEVRLRASSLGFLANVTAKGHWSAQVVCGIMCALRPALKMIGPTLVSGLPAEVVKDAFQHNFVSYSRSLQNVVVNHRMDDSLREMLDMRVVFLHGENDRASPLENVRSLTELSPLWQLEIVSDVGHYLPFVKPEVVAHFLDEGLANRQDNETRI